jgi:hypothetical protein
MALKQQQHSRLIELADEHKDKDQYVQGFGYWQNGKGCSVGCTIADAKCEGLCNGVAYDDHKALAGILGVTEFITRLQDNIFEGLPAEDAMAWTGRLLRSIKPGTDYASVSTRMSIAMLRDPEIGLCHTAILDSVKTVAHAIAALYERRFNRDEPKDEEWHAAWQQAYAARQQAYAAWQQAYAARQQADAARQQAYAAWQQAYAAWQQAYAARQQADAARQRFWLRAADLLIDAMNQCNAA